MAVLSHELRNPLAPITNSLYILDHAVPGGEQANRAQAVIGRQVGQLARLVDDLLDVTRISHNKIPLQRQRLDLNELVRRTLEDHRPQFEANEVLIELAPAPKPVLVSGDRNRLAQVVGNLLQNAAKFTGPGGRVRAIVSVDSEGKLAVVRVADTGVGMAPEMLARLFQPFSQADATLDRSKGGLGLGLALVKGLVELHGGTISAHSPGLGQGAEFVVRLPLALEETATDAPALPRAPGGRRRVLIIEDNIDAADSLREALEFSEHEVEVAYNGPAGIAKARKYKPEVVFCDIGLPGMDGFDVARAFRADDALRGTYLVALSGYAQPEDVLRASEAGFDQHLAKPPSLERLEQALAHVPVAEVAPEPSGESGFDEQTPGPVVN
jgi:two-component system CheB/CheR fusion protein